MWTEHDVEKTAVIVTAAISDVMEAIAVAARRSAEETLGQRLARLRRERGITQVELAEQLDLTQALISQYEREEVRLHGELIVELAEILGVSGDELLGIEKRKRDAGMKNRRLVRYMREIDQLPKRDQRALLRTIDTFIKGARV